MAKRSFTYRFKVSATNEGDDRSRIYTFNQEIHRFKECESPSDGDKGTFVIKEEDVRFRRPITLKNNKDVLHYILRNFVSSKKDTCIVEYELRRKNTFSTNEFISDELRDDVKFMVNAIYAIGDNTLIDPKKEITEMRFYIPLHYVSSEIFYRSNVRATSDSPNKTRTYLKDFITAFFRLIPKDAIEKYDTLYEKREKERMKNTIRDEENGEIICSISPEKRKTYGGKAFALVSRLIKKDLILNIGDIIASVYKGQKFCFESFAHWKNAIIAFLNIDGKSIKYEDSNTPNAILKEISNERYIEKVEQFLYYIENYYIREREIKKGVELSAILYKFLTVCPTEYISNKFKRRVGKVDKEFKRAEFKNLCLQYFGLAPNQYKPNDCEKIIYTKFKLFEDNYNVWDKIK
mgnify:FL=1